MAKKLKKYGPMGGDPGLTTAGPNMSFKSKSKKKVKKMTPGPYGGGGLTMCKEHGNSGCKQCGVMVKDSKIKKKLIKPSKQRTQRIIEFLKQPPKNPTEIPKKPKGSFKLLPKPKSEIKKEVPASPNLGIAMKSRLKKSFTDMWIIRIGDEFQKMADAHQLPFERNHDIKGVEHTWIFKCGECVVKFSSMGKDSKIKMDSPEKVDELHHKFAKTMYYRLMIEHEMPLQKAKRSGSGMNIRGKEYSRQWQEGLADQKLRQQKSLLGQKRRPQLGTKKPKSGAARRLSRQQLRLFGEQEYVGKSMNSYDKHKELSPHKDTHKMERHGEYNTKTNEGIKGLAAHIREVAILEHKLHSTTGSSNPDAPTLHISSWAPKKKLTKSGRVFVNMIRKAYEEKKELGKPEEQDRHQKPKRRKTKKKLRVHPGVYKALGLSPQRSKLKVPAKRDNINISARAGRPQLNTGIKPAVPGAGAPKITTKSAAITPVKPTIDKPSIDTKKSKLKRKVKKDAITFSPPFGNSTGQDRF